LEQAQRQKQEQLQVQTSGAGREQHSQAPKISKRSKRPDPLTARITDNLVDVVNVASMISLISS
jgi:hypothetical protein